MWVHFITSTHTLCFRENKINVYPCKPQFYNIKVGYKGVLSYHDGQSEQKFNTYFVKFMIFGNKVFFLKSPLPY